MRLPIWFIRRRASWTNEMEVGRTMKKIGYWWCCCWLLGMWALGSCTGRVAPAPLQRAAVLADSAPRTADSLLRVLSATIGGERTAVRMRYELVRVVVDHQLDRPLASDSVLRRLSAYYDRKGPATNKVLVHYYWGIFYRSKGDAPRALEHFRLAEKVARETEEEAVLIRVLAQVGNLHRRQGHTTQALEVLQEAYRLATRRNDARARIILLRDIAFTYYRRQQLESAIGYYHLAVAVAQQGADKRLVKDLHEGLLQLYLELDNAMMVGYIPNDTLPDVPYKNVPMMRLREGMVAMEQGRRKEARELCMEARQQGNIYTKAAACRLLSDISRQAGQDGDAAAFKAEQRQYEDSIRLMKAAAQLRRMEGLYNYELRDKESEQLQVRNRELQLYLYVAMALLIIVLLGVTAHRLYAQNRRAEKARKLAHWKALQQERYERSEQRVAENERLLEQLRMQLVTTEEHSRALVQTQLEQLEQTNRQIAVQQKEEQLRGEALKRTPVYQKFRHAVEQADVFVPSQAEWQGLEDAVNEAYPRFVERLFELYPALSVIERRTCLLVKIGLPITTIAALLGRSKSSVSNSRRRLYVKLMGVEGTTEQFDRFIDAL